jgi:gluconate:H+ symporter, GntP family
MIPASLVLPAAFVAVVLLVQFFRLPAYLALMAVTAIFGIAADMAFHTIGATFGHGFAATVTQVGLLVVAGSLVQTLVRKQPLPWQATAGAGLLVGLGASPLGGLALLQPAARTATAVTALVLTILVTQALATPAPLALAAMYVMKILPMTMLLISLPVAFVVIAVVWLVAARESVAGAWSWQWLAVAAPLVLMALLPIAGLPIYPMRNATDFVRGINSPLMLTLITVGLGLLLSRTWRPAGFAGDFSWAPLLLTVGAAGGFSHTLASTGMPPLLAEYALDPRLGLLVPFLAAAIVKTAQGDSLSAVLTAAGMAEPMLPALGLDSDTGRTLAAAAAGAGAIAVCHVNDPLFWIGCNMAGMTPLKGLRTIGLGSAAVASGALLLLVALRAVVL